MGCISTMPPSTFTSISGDEPTSVTSPVSKKNMYGDGFTVRSPRYTANGSSDIGAEKRCDGTIWNASPAKMYSRQRSTAASNASRDMLLVTGPSTGSPAGADGRGSGPDRRPFSSAIVATVRQYAASCSSSSSSSGQGATIVRARRRWSNTTTGPVTRAIRSGRPRSSGGSPGRRSTVRTRS